MNWGYRAYRFYGQPLHGVKLGRPHLFKFRRSDKSSIWACVRYLRHPAGNFYALGETWQEALSNLSLEPLYGFSDKLLDLQNQ